MFLHRTPVTDGVRGRESVPAGVMFFFEPPDPKSALRPTAGQHIEGRNDLAESLHAEIEYRDHETEPEPGSYRLLAPRARQQALRQRT